MYILFPSVLPDTKIKPHKILAIIYDFLQEKSKPSLTFNPGLALTSFRTTWPRSFATPPRWATSPSQVIPQHFVKFAGTHYFIILGGERHCESKVSCPRTQHNDPRQGHINLQC